LAHSFRGFGPWSGSSILVHEAEYHEGQSMVDQNCSPHGSQEAEQEGAGDVFPGHAPRDLLPLTRPLLLAITSK
jgi:hypothetical protein